MSSVQTLHVIAVAATADKKSNTSAAHGCWIQSMLLLISVSVIQCSIIDCSSCSRMPHHQSQEGNQWVFLEFLECRSVKLKTDSNTD